MLQLIFRLKTKINLRDIIDCINANVGSDLSKLLSTFDKRMYHPAHCIDARLDKIRKVYNKICKQVTAPFPEVKLDHLILTPVSLSLAVRT